MGSHEVLIEQLSRDAKPVYRPWTNSRRVIAWLLMALPSGALSSLMFQRVATDWTQPGAVLAVLQLVLVFITGTLAIRNAFAQHCRANALSWRWFVPLVVLWLGSVGFSPVQTHVQAHHPDEVNCYVFMMAVSAPMVALVIGYLRRTRAVSANTGGGGSGRRLYGVNVASVLPSR
jgi:hypothetical protein